MPDFFTIFFDNVSESYQAINGPNADKTFTAADGLNANGLAAIQSNKSGKFAAFPVAGAAQAVLTTALGATNNIKYTAKALGTGGNSITVRYVVAGLNTALSVSVSGSDITVNVATNGAGAATSTVAQVLSAISGSTPASALVTAVVAPGNDTAAVVSAMAATALSTGTTGAAVVTNTVVGVKADSTLTTF